MVGDLLFIRVRDRKAKMPDRIRTDDYPGRKESVQMSTYPTVGQGKHLAGIAADYGFSNF
jgi:hypothetical protein